METTKNPYTLIRHASSIEDQFEQAKAMAWNDGHYAGLKEASQPSASLEGVKRYDFKCNESTYGQCGGGTMIQSEDGDYVEFDDIAHLLTAKKEDTANPEYEVWNGYEWISMGEDAYYSAINKNKDGRIKVNGVITEATDPHFERTPKPEEAKKEVPVSESVLADIRNKLSPIKTFINLLENHHITGTVDLSPWVRDSIEQSKKSVEYLANLPLQQPPSVGVEVLKTALEDMIMLGERLLDFEHGDGDTNYTSLIGNAKDALSSLTGVNDILKVTRVELIDDKEGRMIVLRRKHVELSFQDESRTLKVFVRRREEGK